MAKERWKPAPVEERGPRPSPKGTTRMRLNVSPDSMIGVPVGDEVIHIAVDEDCYADVPLACVASLRAQKLTKD